jgi:hypothetical protein
VPLAKQGKLVQRVKVDLQVVQVPQGKKVMLVLQEKQENVVLQESVVLKAYRVLQENVVLKDYRVLKVSQALLVKLVPEVKMERMELEVILDIQV